MKVVMECSNCKAEKILDETNVSESISNFYRTHKTRIGKSYCKRENIHLSEKGDEYIEMYCIK